MNFDLSKLHQTLKNQKVGILLLVFVLIMTVFGTAVLSQYSSVTGRLSFADEAKTILPFCEIGDLDKKDGKDICTNANKEETTINLCSDGKNPKVQGQCDQTQTSLFPVYNNGECPAGFSQIYTNGGYRNGKLCSVAPAFFSISNGCPRINPAIAGLGGNGETGPEFAESIYNYRGEGSDQLRLQCYNDCPIGTGEVLERASLDDSKSPLVYKPVCRSVGQRCIPSSNNVPGGSTNTAPAFCDGKEFCNANFEGECKAKEVNFSTFCTGGFLGIGANCNNESSSTVYNLVNQKIRFTRPICENGFRPFLSITGEGNKTYSNPTLCAKTTYKTSVTYVPGGAFNSKRARQCTDNKLIEVFFNDQNISDSEMDLLCVPKLSSPVFEKATSICPLPWKEFDTTKCYVPAVLKEFKSEDFTNVFENSCNRIEMVSAQKTICTSVFSPFLNGKITFSNDVTGETCTIVVPAENNGGRGQCELTLSNSSFIIKEYLLKAYFDKIDINKPAGKIIVSPVGCTDAEKEIDQACKKPLADVSSYTPPKLTYGGAFQGPINIPNITEESFAPDGDQTVGAINEAEKKQFLEGLEASTDPTKIASDKELGDAIKCIKGEADKTIITCEGQLPPGKTASGVNLTLGDENIDCKVEVSGKVSCTPTKIKLLESNPDTDLALSIKTDDNPKLTEIKKLNFAKGTELLCKDNYEECFDNVATQDELAAAIKCNKDPNDPTVVICEGTIPSGKTADDIKIRVGDNSIVTCSINAGKVNCAPTKVKELIDNPSADIGFSIQDKLHTKFKEVKKINFLTGVESFCSVKTIKCSNQGATKVTLATSNSIDQTCSGIDNKCLSGTGDVGNAKGYKKEEAASQGPNYGLIIPLVLMGLVTLGGAGYFVWNKYFRKI